MQHYWQRYNCINFQNELDTRGSLGPLFIPTLNLKYLGPFSQIFDKGLHAEDIAWII